MDYGIRTRGLGGTGGSGGGPGAGPGCSSSWLESAAAAYGNPLAAAYQLPSGAALLLNSLHSLHHHQSNATAMELVWKPGKREPPDDEDELEDEEVEDDDEEERASSANGEQQQQQRRQDQQGRGEEDEARVDGGRGAERADEEDEDDEEEDGPVDGEENEASTESWRDTPMPVLSGWMLGAYTSMLGRLSAATAALENAEGSNLTSDSDSESDHSSYTDMLSRESSPSIGGVRQSLYPCGERGVTNLPTRTKKKRTSDASCKPRVSSSGSSSGGSSHNNNNNNGKEASSSDASAAASQQGKKRSLALQRVRYEREEYRCSLCSYACTIEKAFQRHLRAHARGTATETRVSCAVCGADRSSEVDLSKHMRRHRDNRYFCCDICIFRTVQLKKLIQHRRMHTGEKPHLCPHCAYRSARRDNLRSHVRRVHKKENLYCDTFSPRGMFIAPKLHDGNSGAQHPDHHQQQQQQQPEEANDTQSNDPLEISPTSSSDLA